SGFEVIRHPLADEVMGSVAAGGCGGCRIGRSIRMVSAHNWIFLGYFKVCGFTRFQVVCRVERILVRLNGCCAPMGSFAIFSTPPSSNSVQKRSFNGFDWVR